MVARPRILLLTEYDVLYRMGFSEYLRLLYAPADYPLARFAGQRIRQAAFSVESVSQKATRAVGAIFAVLNFDEAGLLPGAKPKRRAARASVPANQDDPRALLAQAHAKLNLSVWTPSPDLQWRLQRAALGQLPCRRLT